MELGEGLELIENLIENGNHDYSDSKTILYFTVRFLNNAYKGNMELNSGIIEFAYISGVNYAKAEKAVDK